MAINLRAEVENQLYIRNLIGAAHRAFESAEDRSKRAKTFWGEYHHRHHELRTQELFSTPPAGQILHHGHALIKKVSDPRATSTRTPRTTSIDPLASSTRTPRTLSIDPRAGSIRTPRTSRSNSWKASHWRDNDISSFPARNGQFQPSNRRQINLTLPRLEPKGSVEQDQLQAAVPVNDYLQTCTREGIRPLPISFVTGHSRKLDTSGLLIQDCILHVQASLSGRS